jgi:hypothetical protein
VGTGIKSGSSGSNTALETAITTEIGKGTGTGETGNETGMNQTHAAGSSRGKVIGTGTEVGAGGVIRICTRGGVAAIERSQTPMPVNTTLLLLGVKDLHGVTGALVGQGTKEGGEERMEEKPGFKKRRQMVGCWV